MQERIEELKKDIAELQALQNQSTRPKVKDILSIELRKLGTELIKLQEKSNEQLQSNNKGAQAATASASSNKCYEVKINNYAWDQTTKFVKFYVTLAKVHTIPQENISCQFTSKSLELKVKNLNNKDYVFVINNLLNTINPESSNWKVKTDMILINASKVSETSWSHVTELEKKSVDAQKMSTVGADKADMDPNEGLMSLMKNMYDKGDDEMKRTIAKAWTESQAKKFS